MFKDKHELIGALLWSFILLILIYNMGITFVLILIALFFLYYLYFML